MRLLVTGAGGGLARAFLAQVPAEHEVHAFTHRELDITDHDAVMVTVTGLRPDAILNLAAMARVDDCERAPEDAYRVNALALQSLALAARRVDTILLHVSTDYVFDGEKGAPYDELDRPNPLSVYGRSKLGGELFVRRLLAEHFIVRTAWLFGTGSDHLSTALDRLARGERVGSVADRTGSPTFVRHLASRLLPLIRSGRFGTYHLAGPEPTTWFELVSRARALGGFGGEVVPQRGVDLGLVAPRPRYSALASVFGPEVGVAPLPPLDVALKELVDARGG